MSTRAKRGSAHRRKTISAGSATTACALAALALASAATASPGRLHAPAAAGARASSAAVEAAHVAAYWTPARMRAARPLEGGAAGAPIDPLVPPSFAPVPDATIPPFPVIGRVFVRQGRKSGYCSATAINSASRRLVLTAGHCVNTGPRGRNGSSAWSRLIQFVPAYTDGTAPFGVFIARRPEVFSPQDWVQFGNPNFDLGAFLVKPNELGVNVADAVGGGATIAVDRPRKEDFESFGYPGKTRRMQRCDSPSVGQDRLTYGIPGPPTTAIRCHWLPGASGGGWLIDGGTTINGLTSYGRTRDDVHTFGPYFSSTNLLPLVKGF
jgi:V8-like Glu-specific endopeptidase